MTRQREITIACSNTLGRPAHDHDVRITISKNVTYDLSRDNVILVDKLEGKTTEEYINMILQPSIDEYNQKQKRADRKINCSYTDWHKLNDNKGDMVYELVMQYGEHADLGKAYYEAESVLVKEEMRNEFIAVYSDWLREWQERHPNLKILWATIHFDEENGTPHLHAAICPIHEGFVRGPKMQISLSKALEADGFARSGKRKEGFQLERAFNDFREYQERTLTQGYGYIVKERTDKKHEDAELFRETEKAKEELEQAKTEAERIEKVTTQQLKDAEHKMEKAKAMTDFIEPIKEAIEQEKEKIINTPDTETTFSTQKDGLFGKPYEVAIQRKEVYESKKAQENIKRLSELAEDAVGKVKTISEKTLDSIENGTNRELEAKVDNLEKELFAERQKNIELTRTVQKFETIIENVKSFLREFGLVKKWTQFLDKIKQREQEQIRERQI